MTIAKATSVLLERLSAGSTLLLSIHLALSDPPSPGLSLPDPASWTDGVDADGRHVVLVGAHALRSMPEGEEAIAIVLTALAEGHVPPGVHAVAYAPKLSTAVAGILAADGVEEALLHGPRGTGKTQGIPGILAMLAEFHARAGFPMPLRALWLHDSLTNASVKTGRSLEAPLWGGGLWTLRDDRRTAVLTVGGTEMLLGDFVGTQDMTSSERLRAECHVIAGEELIPSLEESGGVEERKYELALTSMRLPTRRRIAVSATNPGAPDTWPYKRFIEGGGRPGCVAFEVPASDRLTLEDVAMLAEAFRDSPDLKQRLALGEWSELRLGPLVTPGFTDAHVAPQPLKPIRNVPLVLAHDGGHTPVTIVGARYQGAVLVYASLSSEHAGTRQHLQSLVLPWLRMHAEWALANPGSLLRHYYDPSMATGEQADIDADPVRVIRSMLGGPMHEGAVSWPGRIEPVTALLGQFNSYTGRPTLQIDAIEGALLIRALRGRWYYPMVNGKVSRDLPKKPNHPFEDAGDSFCYFVGGIAPTRAPRRNGPPGKSKLAFNPFDFAHGMNGGRRP
jgi:hypothetical protein